MQPQAFYRVVADDFTAVDGIIRKQLVSRVPLVEKIGDYIISAGGKRLRPLLVLARDYPVIQAMILLTSGIYVGVNLLIDVAYTLLDPRIRY